MKMELRVDKAEIRAANDGKLKVSGYVNETESQSGLLGKTQKFIEVIKRGAWQRAIDNALQSGKDIHFYAEHDKNKILASTRNGSLELREDDRGLFMEATISPTSWGKDYYQLIDDGILQNMSFGFRSVKDAWRNMGDHFQRTVNELELFEVSVVRDPAYAGSSISARGIDLIEDEVPSSELNLRTIEIRSDEDIEKIAKKIFEMLQNSTKVAEQHEEDPNPKEPEVEEKQEPEQELEVEEQKPDSTPEKPEDTEKVEEVDEKEEIEDKEEKVEEVKDPEPEPEPIVEEPINGADKIRDFIKQFK